MVDRSRVAECAPGVFHILGAQRSAHAYLLRGSRRIALVDTGLPGTTPYLVQCLETLGIAPRDIDVVILTHEHIDHAGGASHFAGTSLIAAHRQAAAKLQLAEEFSIMNKGFDAEVKPFEADLLVEEGTVIDLGGIRLEVIHTPGHCSGSICLYEPARRLLLSADTIMAQGVVGGVLMSGNISDYIESLDRLARLRIDLLLPGHGKLSSDAERDILAGRARLVQMLEDSHTLFASLRDTGKGFADVMRSLRDLNLH